MYTDHISLFFQKLFTSWLNQAHFSSWLKHFLWSFVFNGHSLGSSFLLFILFLVYYYFFFEKKDRQNWFKSQPRQQYFCHLRYDVRCLHLFTFFRIFILSAHESSARLTSDEIKYALTHSRLIYSFIVWKKLQIMLIENWICEHSNLRY